MDNELTPATIDKIVSLVKDANKKDNRVITLDLGEGPRQFDAQSLKRIYDDPRPGTLEVSSLSAISDYVREELEGVEGSKLFARIVSPTQVELLEAFSGDQKERTMYMRAKLVNDVTPFCFGTWYDTETFVISLMSLFEVTADSEKVLAVASSLVSEARVVKTDDKSTTKTQANAGVINNSGVEITEVVNLVPFRTFRQVPQPASAFIFRYRAKGDEIGLALFEADGGAWKHVAMGRIAAFFEAQVPELKVIA